MPVDNRGTQESVVEHARRTSVQGVTDTQESPEEAPDVRPGTVSEHPSGIQPEVRKQQ